MSIITRMRKQKAVYWPPGSEASGGSDFDDYGQPLYASAVEIDCRWEAVNTEYLATDGQQRLSNAIVYVDQDVKPRGVLLLGELAAVSDLVVPKNNEGAWEIRRFDKLPNLKVTEYLRTAYL